MERSPVKIAWLDVADSPDLWRDLGYVVDSNGVCVVGGIPHRLLGSHLGKRGLVGWALTGVDPDTASIDGIATTVAPDPVVDSSITDLEHPNHVSSIDHVVIRTSSTPRTAHALENLGLVRRGHSDSTSSGEEVAMTFFWMGATLLEIVGPPEPAAEARPAKLMGIAYVSSDLDRTAAFLGDRCSRPKDAIQPGRRISALRSSAGSTLPMAFMTPHIKAGSS